MAENIMGKNITNTYLSRSIINSMKSARESIKQTLVLGLSGSLNGGAVYSYIVSLGHFTPAVGIIAGLVGGSGVAARDILSGKEKSDDIPLKNLVTYILFGIAGLFLGYILVYYFVKLPTQGMHGRYILPAEQGTIYEFFNQTMGLPDIIGAILGSICSSAIPIIFKEKIRTTLKKLNINRFYPASE